MAKSKKTPKWLDERLKAIEERREITRRYSEQYYAAQAARERAEQGDKG